MGPTSRIYVAGHRGMVGSALVRRLKAKGYTNIVTRTHQELDLIDQQAVRHFFQNQKIDYVFLSAAKVGGICANYTYPADFIYQNTMIQANVIHEAYRAGIQRLLFMGSSCIYPNMASQPLKEKYLLNGPLEPSNEPYAIAKIAGIELCEAYNRQHGTRFLSVMPTNLYGPNDNYDLETSHVLPAMVRKFHLAKLASKGDSKGINKDEGCHGQIPDDIRASLASISRSSGYEPLQLPAQAMLPRPAITLWGTGSPCREFLYVDDLADACLFLITLGEILYCSLLTANRLPLVNIGCGEDLTIRDLASLVAQIVGYEGEIIWDKTKPDGTPRKLLDISTLSKLGWSPRVGLEEGIEKTYSCYLKKAAYTDLNQ